MLAMLIPTSMHLSLVHNFTSTSNHHWEVQQSHLTIRMKRTTMELHAAIKKQTDRRLSAPCQNCRHSSTHSDTCGWLSLNRKSRFTLRALPLRSWGRVLSESTISEKKPSYSWYVVKRAAWILWRKMHFGLRFSSAYDMIWLTQMWNSREKLNWL